MTGDPSNVCLDSTHINALRILRECYICTPANLEESFASQLLDTVQRVAQGSLEASLHYRPTGPSSHATIQQHIERITQESLFTEEVEDLLHVDSHPGIDFAPYRIVEFGHNEGTPLFQLCNIVSGNPMGYVYEGQATSPCYRMFDGAIDVYPLKPSHNIQADDVRYVVGTILEELNRHAEVKLTYQQLRDYHYIEPACEDES
ncbi:MAG: hypothetical protein EP343_09030 [Deltaproteobacteria bacterium]|nr:MAG: hypothetical protein EP343_09030 [Deltaproteobacteria bacterium]